MTTLTTPAPRAMESKAQVKADPLPVPTSPAKSGWWWGTGRRKSAVARVRIKPGSGVFQVNGRDVNAFFTEPQHKLEVHSPLKATKYEGKLEIQVQVAGGGFTGQAGAVLLGLARAIKGYDGNVERDLRDGGLLTRDAREVERKKYGQSGARRRFQFSKR